MPFHSTVRTDESEVGSTHRWRFPPGRMTRLPARQSRLGIQSTTEAASGMHPAKHERWRTFPERRVEVTSREPRSRRELPLGAGKVTEVGCKLVEALGSCPAGSVMVVGGNLSFVRLDEVPR